MKTRTKNYKPDANAMCDSNLCSDCRCGRIENGHRYCFGSKCEKIVRTAAIDECKQILFEAIAKEGKTKCHNYMVALEKMEKLKE